MPFFDPRTNVENLSVVPVSQAQANQRAGRAGRVRSGKCFRLYTESSFYNDLPKRTVPEMQRTNLAMVILQLKSLGIDDIVHYEFMDPPNPQLLITALELLYATGAIDDQCKLTKPIGRQLCELPVEPKLAKMLLESGKSKCAEEILSIAAMLSVQSPFLATRSYRSKAQEAHSKFAVHEGDPMTLLNVYNAFLENGKDPEWCKEHFLNIKALRRANDIRRELRRCLVRLKIPVESIAADPNAGVVIRKCIVAGYFQNAAQLQNRGSYRSVRGNQELAIHPSSSLVHDAPRWVVFHEVVASAQLFMRDLTVIEPMWLSEIAPHFYEYKGAGSEESEAANSKSRPEAMAPRKSSSLDMGLMEEPAEEGLVTVRDNGGERQVKHRKLF